MRALLMIAGLGLLGGPALADEMVVEVELPQLKVAEYHRPYVAVWVARPDQSVAATLEVWYAQEDGPEGEGESWLKDLRQWWRRIGRTLEMPVDGVSGPTRAPGSHVLTYAGDTGPLKALPPGEYVLQVEAAREVGGRELVSIPFTWPGTAKAEAKGETELGGIRLTLVQAP